MCYEHAEKPRNMSEQGKVRRNSGGGRGKVATDQSNHLVAGSIRGFPHFQEKANDLWNRERVLLDPFANFKCVRFCGNFR